MAITRSDVLRKAQSFADEKKGNIFGPKYGLSSSKNWCAAFVSYIFDEKNGRVDYNTDGLILVNMRTDYIEDDFRSKWQFKSAPSRVGKSRYVSNSRDIQPGDIIFFDRYTHNPKTDTYAPPPNQSSEHIGIVKEIKNGRVYVYEGNNTGTGKSASTRHVTVADYALSDSAILGYGLVNYPREEPDIRPDRYESNNNRATAKYLTGATGTYSNLTLHNSNDEDWFKFEWNGNGSSVNQIRLSTTSSSERFDLYSPSGSLLRANAAVVSLAGYNTRGTYYVKVHGTNGSTSKNYSLTYNIIPKDRYEPNNSKNKATTLSGATGTFSDLTLNAANDEDWFKITLRANGTTRDKISVSHSSGGEFIRLYNASGAQVKGFGRNMDLSGLAAGTYYAKVYSVAPSANYTLNWNLPSSVASSSGTTGSGGSSSSGSSNNSISSAINLSATSGTRNDSISRSGEQDYFKIQLGSRGTSSNYVQASFTNRNGDLDMDLLDSSGRVLESKTGSGDSERLNLSGKNAGTYYVRVRGYRNATNSYKLSWNTASPSSGGSSSGSSTSSPVQREVESNNSRYLADRLTGTSGTLKASIGSTSDEDWFKFTLNGTGANNSKIEVLNGSTQRVTLYNANGTKISSSAYRSVSLANRPAGTYYVRVKDDLGFKSGDYTLRWNTASNTRSTNAATSRAAAPNLTSAQNVMYDSTAGAFASYLNSAGAATQAVSQSTNDSLRKYGTLVQA